VVYRLVSRWEGIARPVIGGMENNLYILRVCVWHVLRGALERQLKSWRITHMRPRDLVGRTSYTTLGIYLRF
jgi:hypothetical protein